MEIEPHEIKIEGHGIEIKVHEIEIEVHALKTVQYLIPLKLRFFCK